MGRYNPPFAPIRASALSLSTGPASPASPLTPKRIRLTAHKGRRATSFASVSPKSEDVDPMDELPYGDPMPWLWVCHKCHSRYPLGATRRCLHDGHYFCGGTTTDPMTGKTRRHKACGSEFDYIGWEDVGYWREKLLLRSSAPEGIHSMRDCAAHCSYPSACHWRAKEQKAIKTKSFDFLDPSCLGKEPAPSAKENLSVQQRTGIYINRLVKAAENRTSHRTTLLSPVDEEHDRTSTAAPKQQNSALESATAPHVSGVSLALPRLDLKRLKQKFNHQHETGIESNHRNAILQTSALTEPISSASSSFSSSSSPSSSPSPSPSPSSSFFFSSSSSASDQEMEEVEAEDNDIDMTDWISDSPISSPEMSPLSSPSTRHTSFSLSDDGGGGAEGNKERESPVSPRRSTWDWANGTIIGHHPAQRNREHAFEESWERDKDLQGFAENRKDGRRVRV